MLRELALRTTAEEVGSQAAEYRRSQGLEQAPIPEKVMVCLSPRPGAERLLRVGARIAGRLATNWYAVRVESPDEDARHGDAEEYQRMEEYQRLARELGAQVMVLKDKNVADALIEFAQQESISHVVFGQSARSRFDILFRGSVINRFLAEVRDATVQVVPIGKAKRVVAGNSYPVHRSGVPRTSCLYQGTTLSRAVSAKKSDFSLLRRASSPRD